MTNDWVFLYCPTDHVLIANIHFTITLDIWTSGPHPISATLLPGSVDFVEVSTSDQFCTFMGMDFALALTMQ